eukprot:3812192-Prymnesium_polylepis.2
MAYNLDNGNTAEFWRKVIDMGDTAANDRWDRYHNFGGARRQPPVAPIEFVKRLQDKKFASPAADREFVGKLYTDSMTLACAHLRQTRTQTTVPIRRIAPPSDKFFGRPLSLCADRLRDDLVFKRQEWGPQDAEKLCKVLQELRCPSVIILELYSNKLGDQGVSVLSETLKVRSPPCSR